MKTTLTFDRRWSMFAPEFTYVVRDQGTWIGEVARNERERRWWASNKTWTGGADLDQTFPTRHEAAIALRHIANGTATHETYAAEETDPRQTDPRISETSDTNPKKEN